MECNSNFLFTIITPVYNRADCIIRCLDSVAEQVSDLYEMIVINDGSTDDTLNKIKSIANRFTNLNIVSYHENRGVNFARNRGIEQANGKFIIFLDSDDTLTSDALVKIKKSIILYPNYSHYLFSVSDRINDKNIPSEANEYQFKDWLSGKVSGDFAHVIKPCCFKELMFIEEFRIYESLNWLRVLRQNQKQIFIPIVIFQRERDRADSVTRESILDNKKGIKNAYCFLNQFIKMYADDFIFYNISNKLQIIIQKAIILGLALGETSCNVKLIKQSKLNAFEKNMYLMLNYRFLHPIFYSLVKLKSLFSQLKRKLQ